MRRVWIWIGVTAGSLAALMLASLLFANTQTGLNSIASLISPITQGRVSVTGLSGGIGGELHAREVALRDITGEPWIVFSDVRLEVSLLALMANHVDIRRVTASRVRWLRLPESEDGDTTLRIDITALDLPAIETEAAISSTPMVWSARGDLHLEMSGGTAADLTVLRQDGSGTYRVNGAVRNGVASGVVEIDEPEGGLAAGLLGLTTIGPIKANFRAEGPANRNLIAFDIDAGALHAEGNGILDLPGDRIGFDFTANAPAMDVRDDLSWQSLSAEGHAEGPFDALTLDSRIAINGFRWNGVSAGSLTGTATGKAGVVEIVAEASTLAIEGTDPKIFAAAPVTLRGRAELGVEGRPFSFTLAHPLASAAGTMRLKDMDRITADITLTRIQPFAVLAGIDVEGSAKLAADIAFPGSKVTIALDGTVVASGGDETIANLIGRDAAVHVSADVAGKAITNIRARVDGATANVQTSGAVREGALDLALSATVADVSKINSGLKGNAAIRATALGSAETARLKATLTGTIGTNSVPPQAVRLTLNGSGVGKPAGIFRGETHYHDAPLALSGTFAYDGNELRLAIERGAWKSATLDGSVTIPRAAPVTADTTVRVANLSDFAWIAGTGLAGTLEGRLQLVRLGGGAAAAIEATARNLAIEEARFAALSVSGEIADPFAAQRLALRLAATGIAVDGFVGTGTADLRGTFDAPSIALRAGIKDEAGRPLKIEAAASMRTGVGEIALSALAIDYRDIKAVLMRPAVVTIDEGLSVDTLALGADDARLTVTGRLMPSLSAAIALDNLTVAQAQSFVPGLQQGTFSGSAQVTGTLDAPLGTVSVQGTNLRIRGAPAGIAPGTMNGRAVLMGSEMQLDATIAFGTSMLKVSGEAPLAAGAAMNFSAKGTADLTLLNDVLSAEGHRVLGNASLDIAIGGTLDRPAISGSVKIADGEFQDYPHGVRLGEIVANIQFQGGGSGVIEFTARAGLGTIAGNGTIDFAASGMPVAITVTARNAEPAASDAFRGVVDADLRITGTLARYVTVGGKVTIRRAESRLPGNFPPEVGTLNVVRPGRIEDKTPNTARPDWIAFDIDVVSPGQFFVRGRGLDAELEGEIHIRGTAASPMFNGAFTMRRGTFDLGGALLTFTTGKITFESDSLRERFDPALDFTAQRSAGGYSMRLQVSGTVSKPKVSLTSTPALPQDEILSQLLYQQNVRQLTPLQLAGMAQAATALGGFGNGGFDPLSMVRRTLGLDRLSLVGGPGSQSQLEAGRYVASGIYVGARQGLSNSTQAEVQVDLTDNLKAKATVGLGTSANAAQGSQRQSSSSTLGLTWQFEY